MSTALNDDKIRISIAEACGWKPEVRRCELPEVEFVHEETFWTKDGETRRGPWLPMYTTDLNAMHEAENCGIFVSSTFTESYAIRLHAVLERDCRAAGKTPMLFSTTMWHFVFAHATARQRAEAFLRTIKKWKDV